MRLVTSWTDGRVVLYWLNKTVSYKQFIWNRVNKINEKEFINWCYASIKENPAGTGSTGILIVNILQVWWEDPTWLPDKTKWWDQPFVTSTTESEKEAKCIKELVTTTIQCNEISEYHYMLKYEFNKTLRILAWSNRCIIVVEKARSQVR